VASAASSTSAPDVAARFGTLCIPCAARTPLVVTSVHAFIWPFSRAARRPCSGRALYAPQTPVNHIDGARISGFPSLDLSRSNNSIGINRRVQIVYLLPMTATVAAEQGTRVPSCYSSGWWAMSDGSRPARRNPPIAAAVGNPTTIRTRSSTGT